MSWTLTDHQLAETKRRAQDGEIKPADVWRLIGAVEHAAANAKALEIERDTAAEIATSANGRIATMRELAGSGCPPPTLLAGLLYHLGDDPE